MKTIIPLGMTGLLCVCVLCYCTQLTQYLQCIKLNLCVAGTIFFSKYSCYTHMPALDHGFGFLVPVALFHHSRIYFSFPTNFHEFAKGFSLSITTQIPWDQPSSELQYQIHYCTIPSHFTQNSCCLHYLSLLCRLLRPNPSNLKRSMNFILIS